MNWNTEWWLTVLAIIVTRIFIGIPLVTTFFSIPTFKAKKKSFKIISTIVILNFLLISAIVVPIAKIVSFIVDRHKKKKGFEKAIEEAEKATQIKDIELVYCPECGKAYAKGEEPYMCKCGYIFSKSQGR